MSYDERNQQEAEAMSWWSGGATGESYRQQEAAAERARDEERQWTQARWMEAQGGRYPQATTPSGMPRLVLYVIIAFLLISGVEFITVMLQQFIVNAFSITQMAPPVALLNWVFLTGRLFTSLAIIALFLNWFLNLIGSGCLGNLIQTVKKFCLLLFFSGIVTACLTVAETFSK